MKNLILRVLYDHLLERFARHLAELEHEFDSIVGHADARQLMLLHGIARQLERMAPKLAELTLAELKERAAALRPRPAVVR